MGTSEELEIAAPPWPAWEPPSVTSERRRVVARGLLAHRTAAEIAEELERLPADLRPVDCSPTAVEREVAALRDEWAKGRAAKLERLVDEDLARFEEIERALLPEARSGDPDAIDRWLRLQAARAQRVGQRNGGSLLETGVAVNGDDPGSGRAIEVRVRYVDDWRAVRNGALGVGVVEGE